MMAVAYFITPVFGHDDLYGIELAASLHKVSKAFHFLSIDK
jgi:hypothetical protein